MSNHRPRSRRARTLLSAGAGLIAVTLIGCTDRTVSNVFPPQPPADLSPEPVFGTADLGMPDFSPMDGNPLPPDAGHGDLGDLSSEDLTTQRG